MRYVQVSRDGADLVIYAALDCSIHYFIAPEQWCLIRPFLLFLLAKHKICHNIKDRNDDYGNEDVMSGHNNNNKNKEDKVKKKVVKQHQLQQQSNTR
jgi:hypothetical protein